MVSEMLFSAFCSQAIFLNRYPNVIPVNINPIMVNILNVIMRLDKLISDLVSGRRTRQNLIGTR